MSKTEENQVHYLGRKRRHGGDCAIVVYAVVNKWSFVSLFWAFYLTLSLISCCQRFVRPRFMEELCLDSSSPCREVFKMVWDMAGVFRAFTERQ
jgi:hypothetical protein